MKKRIRWSDSNCKKWGRVSINILPDFTATIGRKKYNKLLKKSNNKLILYYQEVKIDENR